MKKFLLLFVLLTLAGLLSASEERGNSCYINKNYECAIKEWGIEAQKGNKKAAKNLAAMYANGQGVEVDYIKASRLFWIAGGGGVWTWQLILLILTITGFVISIYVLLKYKNNSKSLQLNIICLEEKIAYLKEKVNNLEEVSKKSQSDKDLKNGRQSKIWVEGEKNNNIQQSLCTKTTEEKRKPPTKTNNKLSIKKPSCKVSYNVEEETSSLTKELSSSYKTSSDLNTGKLNHNYPPKSLYMLSIERDQPKNIKSIKDDIDKAKKSRSTYEMIEYLTEKVNLKSVQNALEESPWLKNYINQALLEAKAIAGNYIPRKKPCTTLHSWLDLTSDNTDRTKNNKRLRETNFSIKQLELETFSHPREHEDRVYFGAWVEAEGENGEVHRFRIVGQDEADFKGEYISTNSPMGKAFLKKEVGDKVIVNAPAGKRVFNLVKVEYE